MRSLAPVFLVVVFIAFFLFGCASKTATQWWRIGNCLVLYEQAFDEKELVAVGQGCDIKRDTITARGELK